MASPKEQYLKEYVQLDAKFKALESERDELRAKIVTDFAKSNTEKYEDPAMGTFTIGHRVTYTFSPAVKKAEETVKILKAKEQQKGTAKVKSDTAYLLFTEPKEE